MTRGKYAARAANARAETASERASRLEAALTEERAAHSKEIVELKATVSRLMWQLEHDGQARAEAAITRVRTTCDEQLAKLKDQLRIAEQAIEISADSWLKLSRNILEVLEDLGFTSTEARDAMDAAIGRSGLFPPNRRDVHYEHRKHLDPERVRVLERVRKEVLAPESLKPRKSPRQLAAFVESASEPPARAE